MTFGEMVSEAIVFLTGVPENDNSNQVNDLNLREIVRRMGQRIIDQIHAFRPVRYRLVSGTSGALTVGSGPDGGSGTVPSDFNNVDNATRVFITNGRFELIPKSPAWLFSQRQRNPTNTGSRPRYYCLRGRTATGRQKVWTYPKNSVEMTLDFENYVPKPPRGIDRPIAPTLGALIGAGALTGTYHWRLTNVTADGETEGGEISADAVLAGQNINLVLPRSESPYVTARRLYRNAAADYNTFLLVEEIGQNTSTAYVDDTADAGLGVDGPPTVLTAITGMEAFPEGHHRTVFLETLLKYVKRDGGDARTAGELSRDCKAAAAQMWREDAQNQTIRREPRYGRSFTRRRGVSW